MGLFGTLFSRREPKRSGRSPLESFQAARVVAARRRIRGGYDAAETTDNNRRHWRASDGLSADAAACADVRKTLRHRARYEAANNCYARGLVDTLANDTIGTGPRLQLQSDDPQRDREIEAAFAAWAQLVDLPGKLRTMRRAQAQDGEAFGIITTNRALDFPVQLDLKLIEADQITSPLQAINDPHEVDGIRLDDFGNPVFYRVLKTHPGGPDHRHEEFVRVPAAAMVHLFHRHRPGQHRGVPELAPALPLFAQLRRYTLAVLGAAEAVADFAGILYTDAPANGEADAGVEPMDLVELERNMLLTMPGGWKMGQVKAEQPATTYAEFKREILNEVARCLNVPYNVAACNSADYNYASGRLDHQTYFKAIQVEQDHIARIALNRIFMSWLWEYSLGAGVTGALPQVRDELGYQWFWDGHEHVDPLKEAAAQAKRLESNTTTLAHEYARQGKDWERELFQRAREQELLEDLGLAAEEAVPQPAGEGADNG